jgi:hypothetical protein
LRIFNKKLIHKIVEAIRLIAQKYEGKSMLPYPSETKSAQLLLVDEPIQKDLEHVDQEIETNDEVTDYHESGDVFYDYCVTQEEVGEDKLLMSMVASDESVEVADLSTSRLVDVSASSAKDLSEVLVSSHYVRNSNRRHGLETCAKAIVSNLEKQDASASLRSGTGLVEGKKETICFSARLS